jgi:hypothetical protein
MVRDLVPSYRNGMTQGLNLLKGKNKCLPSLMEDQSHIMATLLTRTLLQIEVFKYHAHFAFLHPCSLPGHGLRRRHDVRGCCCRKGLI